MTTGMNYTNGLEMTLRCLKQAADRGNTDAQFRYGEFARTGTFVQRNAREAARYYKMAADPP